MTRRTDNRALRSPVPRDQLPVFDPVPRECNRHDGWTPERQLAFIEALADTGSVHAACRAVNMSQPGAYHLRRQPGAGSFREAWAAALDCGVHMLEDKVMERAIHGVEVPVLSCGKEFGTRRVYNERIAMLILQARLPEKYGMQRARAMNGLDKQVLARKKREWRREWEAEEAHKRKLAAQEEAREDREEGEALAAKLGVMHKNWFTCLSPRTRVAYAEFRRLEREDKESGFDWIDQDGFDPHAEGAIIEAQYEENFGEGKDDRPGIWKLVDIEHGGDVEENGATDETGRGPKLRSFKDDG